jgi:hypothetical protein
MDAGGGQRERGHPRRVRGRRSIRSLVGDHPVQSPGEVGTIAYSATVRPARFIPWGLDGDVEINVKKHERPEEHSQKERQELTAAMNGISVAERYHDTDDDVHETEK